MASVMPSERMLSARQVIMMARPGTAPATNGRAHAAAASARMLPQVAVGSWIPAPMKVREASKMMASATRVTVKTMMGAMQLRRTCLIKIHGALAPER